MGLRAQCVIAHTVYVLAVNDIRILTNFQFCCYLSANFDTVAHF